MKNKILPIFVTGLALIATSCNNPTPIGEVVEPFSVPTIILDEDYDEPPVSDGKEKTYSLSEVNVPSNDIHTKEQLAYIMSGYNSVSSFAKGNKELSKSNAITFVVGEEIEEYDEYYIEVSESKDFKESMFFETTSNSVDVLNLKSGTTYYFRGAEDVVSLAKEPFSTLITANTLPRNLSIDGITNVRDIGGYMSKMGGKIRQGLYYRGGRFNVTDEKTTINQESTYKADLTEEGYRQLVEDIGLKTEIDLRMNESHYTSTYAHEYGMITNDTFEDIEYVAFPLNWTVSNMMTAEKETIGKIFKFLADPDVYPVYLHCNIGTDRTGMCTYLLGTLLGIPQEDLYRDYLFSNFGNIGGSRDISKISNTYKPTLLAFNEDNLYYDVRAYLNSCGVTDEELNSIIDIFIDLDIY